SPARRLPPEILDHIFNLGDVENCIRPRKDSQTLPGLALTAVCSQWRDIGQDNQRVWSGIRVEAMEIFGNNRLWEEALDLLLKRSKEHPLDIQL
ncbi:hypothetical protein C8J56DRAFT_748672, partial [Mycena floridula]